MLALVFLALVGLNLYVWLASFQYWYVRYLSALALFLVFVLMLPEHCSGGLSELVGCRMDGDIEPLG